MSADETHIETVSRIHSPHAAISNHMVRLFARYFGRGPTKARTTLNTNVALVVMGETMTRAELSLVAAGEAETVRSMRRTLQHAMREEAVSIIEETLDREVASYMADIDTDANMAIVAFVLEPHGEDGHLAVSVDSRHWVSEDGRR